MLNFATMSFEALCQSQRWHPFFFRDIRKMFPGHFFLVLDNYFDLFIYLFVSAKQHDIAVFFFSFSFFNTGKKWIPNWIPLWFI